MCVIYYFHGVRFQKFLCTLLLLLTVTEAGWESRPIRQRTQLKKLSRKLIKGLSNLRLTQRRSFQVAILLALNSLCAFLFFPHDSASKHSLVHEQEIYWNFYCSLTDRLRVAMVSEQHDAGWWQRKEWSMGIWHRPTKKKERKEKKERKKEQSWHYRAERKDRLWRKAWQIWFAGDLTPAAAFDSLQFKHIAGVSPHRWKKVGEIKQKHLGSPRWGGFDTHIVSSSSKRSL